MSGLYPHIHAYTCSLLLLLGNLGSNSVHIGLALFGESLSDQCAISVLVLKAHLSNELGMLELNEAVSDALASGESAVLGAGSVSLCLGVVLSESVDTDLSSHVELVSDGSSTDVEPVLINWREVLVACGFIVGGPLIKI